jgi:serine/threonine-protein kinase
VPRSSGSSGRLTRSGSSRHGRFEPGTILADRYRIVARLGQGGMGEVYRADDLVLDQPVALKFLPEGLQHDPARIAQLQNEVRAARQVSHPNVCRVHDLALADGLHFLTMEYVDGEDLSSVLKRMGRLSEDRALELARQVCAGVAAAHARGVLHRDLKPANVMLDAGGRVRITDFGLATTRDGRAEALAGTPAYMAPEQLAGRDASEKSDIFALGLVLYELFTGRRAFQAKTIEELRKQHEFRSYALPSEVVPGLTPAVERAILQCLDPDPANRQGSALAVAGALPGGDALALALAAGETPSPEMVAAAGGDVATLSPWIGGLLLVFVLVALGVCAALADRFLLVSRLPDGLSVDSLRDRAMALERQLGLGREAVDRADGFQRSTWALDWIRAQPDADVRARVLATGQPAPLLFWYRSSPEPIVAANPAGRTAQPRDPALDTPGMTLLVLDSQGRLVELTVVPGLRRTPADPTATPVDWSALFTAAGLPMTGFTETSPTTTPLVYADARRAWTGSSPELPGVTLGVEAASWEGLPVSFLVQGPWTPTSDGRPGTRAARGATEFVSYAASVIILPMMLMGGVLLARRNLRRGRGDRLGAWRLAATIFGVELAAWVLLADHVAVAPVELGRLGAVAGRALLAASVYGLFYIALEPQVRRTWPQMLITWSRVIAGHVRDAMVGRDLVVGVAAGLLMTTLTLGHYLLPSLAGWPEFRPAPSSLAALEGARQTSGLLLDRLSSALSNAMLGALGLVLMRVLVRRAWLAFALAIGVFSFLAAEGMIQTGVLALDLAIGAVIVLIVLGTIFRFGLVAGVVAFFTHFVTKDVPLTLDPGKPYFEQSLFLVVLFLGMAATGFVLARSNEPLLGRWLADA